MGRGAFAWAARFRRLARDYERLPNTLKCIHFIAFAILMTCKAHQARNFITGSKSATISAMAELFSISRPTVYRTLLRSQVT